MAADPLSSEHKVTDPFDLNRFIEAQEAVYDRALSELRNGRKETHWMWFIFPQIAGLGTSPMSHRYSIRSVAEARAYLDHPILGPRLIECGNAVLAVENRSATEILGKPDDMKMKSCATLFEYVSQSENIFTEILIKYYDRKRDSRTLDLIQSKEK